MAGTFEVYPDKAGKFRFRLKAGNGQVVAASEAYESKSGAREGCGALQRAIAGAGSCETYEDKAGKFRLRVKSANSQIVAAGQAYESMSGAKEGCAAIKRAADGAKIVEVDS